jgi:hypothetical protein
VFAIFAFSLYLLFKSHLMCCIRKLGPNYSCEIYVTLEPFLDQMHLIWGICLASYSLPKVKGFLFQFDVYSLISCCSVSHIV